MMCHRCKQVASREFQFRFNKSTFFPKAAADGGGKDTAGAVQGRREVDVGSAEGVALAFMNENVADFRAFMVVASGQENAGL